MESGAQVVAASPEEIGSGAADHDALVNHKAPGMNESESPQNPRFESENPGFESKSFEDTEREDPRFENFEDAESENPPGKEQNSYKDEEDSKSPMQIRAPVSEELEDGTGSEESFDSALERIAGSSTASFDTAASPRAQDDSETARVMPKALVTSGSSSDNDEDEDDAVESTGENDEEGTGFKDGEPELNMPVAKVSNEEEGRGFKDEEPKKEPLQDMPFAKVSNDEDVPEFKNEEPKDEPEQNVPIAKASNEEENTGLKDEGPKEEPVQEMPFAKVSNDEEVPEFKNKEPEEESEQNMHVPKESNDEEVTGSNKEEAKEESVQDMPFAKVSNDEEVPEFKNEEQKEERLQVPEFKEQKKERLQDEEVPEFKNEEQKEERLQDEEVPEFKNKEQKEERLQDEEVPEFKNEEQKEERLQDIPVSSEEESKEFKDEESKEQPVQQLPFAKVSNDEEVTEFKNEEPKEEPVQVKASNDEEGTEFKHEEPKEEPVQGMPVAETKSEALIEDSQASNEVEPGEDSQAPNGVDPEVFRSSSNGAQQSPDSPQGNEVDSPETDSEEEEEEPSALRSFSQAAAASSLGSAGPSLPAKPTSTPSRSWEGSRNNNAQVSSHNPGSNSSHNPGSNAQPSAAAATASDNPEPNGEPNDENHETREKLQMIRVKFLRLAQRLGQSAHNVVVAQVLYRLGLAEQLRGGRSSSRNSAFSFERASAIAEEQEAAGQEELDFTCTIMVLGKTGVGKSATINSIFDEVKTDTNAFQYSTKKVQEITGTVHGIKLRVIDTPGLLPAVADQRHNERVMGSVKKFIKKSPPDIVLYFDRLDMQSRDYGDLPLLRTITDTFGAAIWFNAIVVLTHASSAPPDGPNGLPLSYEMFVAQRSHVVQQTIRQAAGDMRLMNPVSLVENHALCRTNRAGERVLPNGQIWKPQLLLLCFASKILAEANSLLKLQESTPGKPFAMRSKVPPLPYLLSSLLQSRAPLKLPDDNVGDEDEEDDDMDEVDDSDEEEEYDDLPPFRRLTKAELDQLDKKNRNAYFEELHLREKLFQKKQWKEELKRRKEARRRSGSSPAGEEYASQMDDGYDDENSKSAAVPVPLPDMALPPSFDSDNPTHRYRYLETASQWLVRPVLETHGWDHDSGYDGLNLERIFVMGKVPASVSGQITKDKKEANLTMECAASLKHGEGKVSQAGFDIQTVGKDLSYTLRSETRFNNFKKNKTIAGVATTMIGETLALGLKLEDRLMIGKRIKVVMNGGALTGKGDTAYGGTVEISLRDKDFPIGRSLSTLGFSVMNWHGDMALGGNLQTQFMVGRTMIVARGNLNNRGAGQITIKVSSSEQLQMALVGLIPVVRALFGNKLFGNSQQI